MGAYLVGSLGLVSYALYLHLDLLTPLITLHCLHECLLSRCGHRVTYTDSQRWSL
jgi:hypothetical protein